MRSSSPEPGAAVEYSDDDPIDRLHRSARHLNTLHQLRRKEPHGLVPFGTVRMGLTSAARIVGAPTLDCVLPGACVDGVVSALHSVQPQWSHCSPAPAVGASSTQEAETTIIAHGHAVSHLINCFATLSDLYTAAALNSRVSLATQYAIAPTSFERLTASPTLRS